MATDLDDRPLADAGSDASNPGQQHYDDVFDELTSKEHMAKDGTSGDTGGGLYNAGGDGEASSSSSSSGSATGKSSTSAGSTLGLYNSAKDGGQRFGKRLGGLMQKKWLVSLGIGGSGIGMLVFLIVILVGTFKIPHLAENITAYQFARVTQQMSSNTTHILSAKISVDAATKSIKEQLAKKYGDGKVAQAWSKLDQFRPNKIIGNMQGSGEARIIYDSKGIAKSIQISSGIGGSTRYRLPSSGGIKGLIPGYGLLRDIPYAEKVAPRLNTAIKANAWGPIVRGSVAKGIRKELGIGLIAWKVGEYKGKSAEQARLLAERESFKKVSGSTAESVRTQPLGKAAAEAASAANEAVADDKQLKETIKNGGKIQAVKDSITASFKDSKLITVLKAANDLYAIATPMCIVWEGSLDRGGSTIDQQMKAQQAAYYLVASAADQQKDGSDGSAEATGAFNEKLGDINGSLPMLRASGQKADTSGYPSAEAGASSGTYSIVDALGGSSRAAKGVDAAAEWACPKLTDLRVAIPVAIVNLASIFVTGGGVKGGEKIAAEAADKALGKVFQKLVTKLTTKQGVINKSGKLGDVISDAGKSFVKIGAITVLAKMIVASKSGYTNNGLEQGADFANMADSGGNIAANEINRKEFYGRPFTKDEAAAATQQSYAFVNEQNASKNAYQRYIALSNPQSLLNKFAAHSASFFTKLSLPSFIKQLGNLMDPSALFSTLFTSVNPQAVHAAAAQDASALNYGNVQFGYSAAEQKLIDSDETYDMLENQRILDKSEKEEDINEEYGACFTETLGSLLSEGKISLDDEGNVKDSKKITCSPKNLTFTNDKFGKQMVFRWRVAHNYDGTMTQLNDMQEETITAGNGNDPPLGKLCNVGGSTDESSGLALSKNNPDLVYTEGDHGWSGPLIYAIQISTCKVVGRTNTNQDGKIDDPESIRIDPSGRLWVADLGDGHPHQLKFGDKDKNEPPSRNDMAIYIFNEPGTGDHKGVAAQRYPIVYSPAGEYHGSYNVEALLIDPSGQAYLISKDGTAGHPGCLFKLPKNLVANQNNVAQNIGCNLPDFVSDATFSTDGKWVFMRTKELAETLVFNATTWKKVGSIKDNVSGKEFPADHIEGITMDADGRSFLLSSETKHTDIKGMPLVRVAIPKQEWIPAGAVLIGSGGSSGPNTVDLSIWKLTLPDTSEIDRGKLQTYNNCPIFCKKSDGILFSATFDSHTEGSKYSRTELRELTAGDSEGKGWSNSSGTHEMIISQAIMTQPKSNSGSVVAGQIHDDEDDVLRILLKSGKLSASWSCGKGCDKIMDLGSYQLGTKFTIKITASGGKTTVTYNGSKTVAYDRAYDAAYFKAGVYPLTTEKGDGGSVMIYGLSVKHS